MSIDISADSLAQAEPRVTAAGLVYRAAEDDGVFCYTFFKGVGRAPR